MADAAGEWTWRAVWRDGLAPGLPTAGLTALAAALAGDDPRFAQRGTTVPAASVAVADWPVEAACAVGFCGWQGEGLGTVGEVEEFFARACFEAEERLGGVAACRAFLAWHDGTPRAAVRAALGAEIDRELRRRDAAERG